MAIAQEGYRQAPPSAHFDGEKLAARLREIVTGTALPIDALDPVLRAILDATSAAAGAVCVYDQRRTLLRLAAESGMSDEGCRRLRTVRRGDVTGWDMPLQGLLNRRAYLIESAAQNRYVPPLAETNGVVRAVACLPIFAGTTPVGSLVLVMVAPASLHERDIRALDRPLRELARLIETVRQQAADGSAPAPVVAGTPVAAPSAAPLLASAPAPEPSPPPVLGPPPVSRDDERVGELTAEVNRLRARLAEAEAGAAHEQRVREELETALQRGASVGQAEVEEAREASRRTEAARAAAVAESARLTAELAELRREIARGEPVAAALGIAEQERARLAAALEAVGVERVMERDEWSAQQATRSAGHAAEVERLEARIAEGLAMLEHERQTRETLELGREEASREERDDLQQAREQLREAEAAREAALAETRDVRDELARVAATLQTAELELARLRDELHAVRTEEQVLRTERGSFAHTIDEASARQLALEERLQERERQLEELRAAHATEVADLTARAAQLSEERDTLHAEATGLATERDRLVAEVEGAAAGRAHLEEALASGLEAARVRESELETRLEEGRTAHAAEVVALVDRLETLRAERDANLGIEVDDEVPVLVPVGEPPAPEPESMLEVLAEEMETGEPPRAAPAPTPVEASGVIVVDVDPAWEQFGSRGVTRVAPGEVGGLAARPPAAALVNLASVGAVQALSALRGSGCAAPAWGCIADPAGRRALALGRVEAATRPLDPDAVLALLKANGTRGARVVTIGDDVEALVSLRQALTREGMSVSMAWNAKQAADLLPMVRPTVVVVDLEMPAPDVSSALAQLAELKPLPLTVLVAPTRETAPALAAMLAEPGAPRLGSVDELLDRIGAAAGG